MCYEGDVTPAMIAAYRAQATTSTSEQRRRPVGAQRTRTRPVVVLPRTIVLRYRSSSIESGRWSLASNSLTALTSTLRMQRSHAAGTKA